MSLMGRLSAALKEVRDHENNRHSVAEEYEKYMEAYEAHCWATGLWRVDDHPIGVVLDLDLGCAETQAPARESPHI